MTMQFSQAEIDQLPALEGYFSAEPRRSASGNMLRRTRQGLTDHVLRYADCSGAEYTFELNEFVLNEGMLLAGDAVPFGRNDDGEIIFAIASEALQEWLLNGYGIKLPILSPAAMPHHRASQFALGLRSRKGRRGTRRSGRCGSKPRSMRRLIGFVTLASV